MGTTTDPASQACQDVVSPYSVPTQHKGFRNKNKTLSSHDAATVVWRELHREQVALWGLECWREDVGGPHDLCPLPTF